MLNINNRVIWYGLAALLACVIVYSLQAILMPFVVGAFFAYLMDPLVDKIQGKKRNRTLAVAIIFLVMTLMAGLVCLALIPMLFKQFSSFMHNIPGYLDVLQNRLLPVLQDRGITLDKLPLDDIQNALQENLQKAGGVLALILKNASSSTLAFFSIVAQALVIPVVSFYLLRDWGRLVIFLRDILPRSVEKKVIALLDECDEVLSAFIRGQLLVMSSLAIIYSVGLSIIGLDLALLLGTLAGLASVVPYLGAIVGILSSSLLAYIQFHEIMPVVYVLLVFGVGQILEGTLLTPTLVGDKIGLHPVAVMFAIMAGGQLAGFVGILLALPVAAVAMVFIRHLHEQYKTSDLYLNVENE